MKVETDICQDEFTDEFLESVMSAVAQKVAQKKVLREAMVAKRRREIVRRVYRELVEEFGV